MSRKSPHYNRYHRCEARHPETNLRCVREKYAMCGSTVISKHIHQNFSQGKRITWVTEEIDIEETQKKFDTFYDNRKTRVSRIKKKYYERR